MPTMTRWSIKAAMLWLLAAVVIGIATSSPATIGLPSDWSRLNPLSWHFLAVGWATQLIFGVSYWMFPPNSKQRPYRSTRLGWTVFVLLNAGLLARLVAEGAPVLLGANPVGWIFLTSATAQFLAAAGFVANTWSRVKTRSS